MRNANTRDATGLCLEPHDAVAAKLIAGREHDVAFAAAALRAALVDERVLRERLAAIPTEDATREHALSLLAVATSRI